MWHLDIGHLKVWNYPCLQVHCTMIWFYLLLRSQFATKKNWLQLFHSNYDDLCNICHPNKHIRCFLYSRLLHCFIYISIDFIPQLWHPYTFILELFVINHTQCSNENRDHTGNGVRYKKRKFVDTRIYLQNNLLPRSNCKADETSSDDILNQTQTGILAVVHLIYQAVIFCENW